MYTEVRRWLAFSFLFAIRRTEEDHGQGRRRAGTYSNEHKSAALTLCKSAHCEFTYQGADKSLARLISRCILFDGENISFDASLVIYIYIYKYNIYI
jgi:hypothetical protein